MFIQITHYVLICYSIISYNYEANYIWYSGRQTINFPSYQIQNGHLKMYMPSIKLACSYSRMKCLIRTLPAGLPW